MAQWLHMFSGHSHSTLVHDRSELLARAIENWNAMESDDRTPASRKKLLRLASDVLRAIVKEKKAYLDRTFLDKHSAEFKTKLAELESLQHAGAPFILKTMGTAGWETKETNEPCDSPKSPVVRDLKS